LAFLSDRILPPGLARINPPSNRLARAHRVLRLHRLDHRSAFVTHVAAVPAAGLDPRENLQTFIAALSPAMLRLAGEIADGVRQWLCNPSYTHRRRGAGGPRRP
jgi:hypothetical protein